MKKKLLSAVIILAASLFVMFSVLLCASILSYVKFGVINPFPTANGLARVIFTEEEYVEISPYPNKVIVAKPDTSLLDDYMEAQGFERDEEQQMGARSTFTDGSDEEIIFYSQNGYYSTWNWN